MYLFSVHTAFAVCFSRVHFICIDFAEATFDKCKLFLVLIVLHMNHVNKHWKQSHKNQNILPSIVNLDNFPVPSVIIIPYSEIHNLPGPGRRVLFLYDILLQNAWRRIFSQSSVVALRFKHETDSCRDNGKVTQLNIIFFATLYDQSQ